MAGEISVNFRMTVNNGGRSFDSGQRNQTIDQVANLGGGPGVISIGTSEEDILQGDVTALGWGYIKNLDPTNYIEVGPKSGGAMVPFLRLYPGMGCPLSFSPAITIRAKADTGPCLAEIYLFQK